MFTGDVGDALVTLLEVVLGALLVVLSVTVFFTLWLTTLLLVWSSVDSTCSTLLFTLDRVLIVYAPVMRVARVMIIIRSKWGAASLAPTTEDIRANIEWSIEDIKIGILDIKVGWFRNGPKSGFHEKYGNHSEFGIKRFVETSAQTAKITGMLLNEDV